MADFETLLEPLTRLTRKLKTIEAHVLWHDGAAWSDAAGETLETEEIVFYAEGLLMEGFGLAWDHLSDPEMGESVRLCFWQGVQPVLPPVPEGSTRLGGGTTGVPADRG